jgi:hypothetical protein
MRISVSLALGAISILGAMLDQGCGNPVVYTPTPVPKMIPYSVDPFEERGIRADPNAPGSDSLGSGGIIVEWNRIDPGKVAGVRMGGYYIYRSENWDAVNKRGLNFRRIARQPVSPALDDTTFNDYSVRQNVVYSYYVTSFNRSDETQESAPSDTVTFMLSERPIPLAPLGDSLVLPKDVPLSFEFLSGGNMAIIVNRVKRENENILLQEMFRKIGIDAGFGTTSNPPHIDYRGADPLVQGQRYRWRVVKYFSVSPGDPPIGNASRWVTFTVAGQ